MWETFKGLFKLYGRPGDSKSDTDRWPKYTVDELGFSEITPDGTGRKYAWSEVNHVGIVTTDDGPFSEDIFFVIKTDKGDICLPNEQATEMKLLDRFTELKGFDYEQVIEAMSSTSDATFVCWTRH